MLSKAISESIGDKPFEGSAGAGDFLKVSEIDWVELSQPGAKPSVHFEVVRLTASPLTPRDLAERVTQTSPANDKAVKSDDTQRMTDITREEFNAKLETIEARMDARVESVSSKIDAFLATQAAVQVEREKAQLERDKRFEALAERATKAAEGAEEAAKQAATVKANYWAAVVVQLLAVVAILAGAYFANQANILGAMQTTMAAFQAGKAEGGSPPVAPPAASK